MTGARIWLWYRRKRPSRCGPGKTPWAAIQPGKSGHREAVYRCGVVADARTVSLAKPDPMLIYVPYWYRIEPMAGLVVRTHQVPSEMADVIRQTIWSVDRGVPVPTVRALGGMVADSVANQRFEMDLLLLFAVSALFLAGLGVYGVLTYSVVQRYREIGLRLALGAQRANVYWLVLRDGLLPVAIGAAAGIALAFGSARVVSSLLFQVSPYDPVVSAGAVGMLLAVGTTACLLQPAAPPQWNRCRPCERNR